MTAETVSGFPIETFGNDGGGGGAKQQTWIPAQVHTGKTRGAWSKITDLDSRSGAYGNDGGAWSKSTALLIRPIPGKTDRVFPRLSDDSTTV